MKKTMTLSRVMGAVVVLCAMAQANLIVNGSFEKLPAVLTSGTWTTYTAIEGWTANDNDHIEVRNNVAGVAQHGDIFVELDAYHNSMMFSDPIATVAGQMYELSYYYAPRQRVAEESNGIALYFNGDIIDMYTSYSTLNNAWEQRVFTVMGTGNDVIRFAAVGVDDSYGGSIDNVVMEAASVPEPSLLMLLSFGLVGLAGYRRKK